MINRNNVREIKFIPGKRQILEFFKPTPSATVIAEINEILVNNGKKITKKTLNRKEFGELLEALLPQDSYIYTY
jgi:hypothetical protein